MYVRNATYLSKQQCYTTELTDIWRNICRPLFAACSSAWLSVLDCARSMTDTDLRPSGLRGLPGPSALHSLSSDLTRSLFNLQRLPPLPQPHADFTTRLSIIPQVNQKHQRPSLEALQDLALSPPIPLRLYNLPYWSNPLFLIFDIRALWRSGLSARAPECQKLKIVD